MAQQNTRFDFGDGIEAISPFVLHEYIISDRGSRYSVSIGHVTNRNEIKQFLDTLKTPKQYRKADHHSWAARISRDSTIYETKNDDGETGAGMVILRTMQKRNVTNSVISVTRWFGGVKLQGDRFKHIQDAANFAIDHLN